MSASREKIVVTGVAGFIGSNLAADLLGHGYDVVGIDNLSAGIVENIPEGTSFHQADILDKGIESFFKGASTCFHLAAKNCLADCAADPVATSHNNVTGTAAVLEACRKAGVRSLVYADTSAEYEGVDQFPSQVDNVRPQSIYACSKRGAALLAESFVQYHDMKLTVVRYFNVYGPAQDWRRSIPPIMSAFTQKLLQGERPTIYGTGEKRRDFIHVDDVNAFHRLLLEKPECQGGVYNLGTGRDFSVLEIFQYIKDRLQSNIDPVFCPDLPGEAERTQADTTQSRQTGWSPQIDLEAGIDTFIDYTKQRLNL